MGIQAGNGNLRVFDSHIPAGLICNLDYLQNAVLLYPVAGFPQGDVGGNVHHPQVVVGQHHRVFLCIGVGCIDLCVAVKMCVSVRFLAVIELQSLIHGFLVQSVRAGCVHLSCQSQLDDLSDALEGSVSSLDAHLTDGECAHILD